jgi:hypothetical protein
MLLITTMTGGHHHHRHHRCSQGGKVGEVTRGKGEDDGRGTPTTPAPRLRASARRVVRGEDEWGRGSEASRRRPGER